MDEKAELEPQIAGEWFVFLDDLDRAFKVAEATGAWRLYAFPVAPNTRWKYLRTLTPFDAVRFRTLALPDRDARRIDERTAG